MESRTPEGTVVCLPGHFQCLYLGLALSGQWRCAWAMRPSSTTILVTRFLCDFPAGPTVAYLSVATRTAPGTMVQSSSRVHITRGSGRDKSPQMMRA